MDNLLKNKWVWIIGGFIFLIIIIAINGGGEEKSVSETSQSQTSQEQQKIEALGLNKFKAKTFMCANFCSAPDGLISAKNWGILKNCMNDCLFAESSISEKIEGILTESLSSEIEKRANILPPELFKKIMNEIGVNINEPIKSETSETNTEIQQEQQIQTQPIPDKIETLVDFENSQFCSDLKCNKEDSWQLSSGGVNHFYHIPLGSDKYNYVTMDVTIENKQVTGFGLMYFDRELSGLRPGDLEIAYKLLNSIDSTRNIDSVKNYIIQNIEKEIFQIMQVSPISWGIFNVYTGKVGQQIISIKRIK